VHLDVLAGRESVRGKTGGNRPLTMELGGAILSVPAPGLAGIKEGGRYVFYRLGGPVGWVSGLTTEASTGAPVSEAVVEGAGLPFIGRTRVNSLYVQPARPGTAQVRATVPGHRLVGSGTVAVTAGGPGVGARYHHGRQGARGGARGCALA
jgi:hypothetical protein